MTEDYGTPDASVVWQGNMKFEGSAQTGFTLPLDAAPGHGGENSGFRPMELTLISLAGCTAMDVLSILQKKRQEVTDFAVRVYAERAEEHPKVYTDIVVEYVVTGRGIDPAAVERAIELSETKYCPAQAMIRPTAKIRHTYHILEAETT
ncbi:MAG: OsmC family protein [Anaerolineae bacterium]